MRNVIKTLICGPEGYVVEIFGLMIYRLENGEYSVVYIKNNHTVFAKEFVDVEIALDKFFETREKNQIGFDFEIEEL